MTPLGLTLETFAWEAGQIDPHTFAAAARLCQELHRDGTARELGNLAGIAEKLRPLIDDLENATHQAGRP